MLSLRPVDVDRRGWLTAACCNCFAAERNRFTWLAAPGRTWGRPAELNVWLFTQKVPVSTRLYAMTVWANWFNWLQHPGCSPNLLRPQRICPIAEWTEQAFWSDLCRYDFDVDDSRVDTLS